MSGLQLSMEVKGLDGLIERFKNHKNIVELEARAAEREGLRILRDEARAGAGKIATDARLANSVTFEVVHGGLEGIVGSVAKSAGSIAAGRKRGETPSNVLLAAWVRRKGLAGETMSIATHKQTDTGRGRSRFGGVNRAKALRSAEVALAWKIAMAIREKGTKPLPFITPAAAAKAQQIQVIFQGAVQRALKKLAKG